MTDKKAPLGSKMYLTGLNLLKERPSKEYPKKKLFKHQIKVLKELIDDK